MSTSDTVPCPPPKRTGWRKKTRRKLLERGVDAPIGKQRQLLAAAAPVAVKPPIDVDVGEDIPVVDMAPSKADRIRAEVARGRTMTSVGYKYGVSYYVVREICLGIPRETPKTAMRHQREAIERALADLKKRPATYEDYALLGVEIVDDVEPGGVFKTETTSRPSDEPDAV